MSERLGRYELLERLAVGGMAELFLAQSTSQHGFKKTVVLKRILPSFAEQPDFVEMFLTEARLAAGLHHPNIAQVFDFGEEDGSHYFTMEFVSGRNAHQVLLAGQQQSIPLPLACALRIVTGVASGLHHAHEHCDVDGNPLDIVHRDVSPSNILVTYEGNVKLVDFGIAKIAARGPGTLAGSLKGKVSYMSPEQCRGELVDRRSDIFSLGIVLWELTTRQKLFGGQSSGLELLKEVAHARIQPPSEVVPGYPRALETIVLKALAPRREQRFGTAQALHLALEEFCLQQQIPLSSSRLATHMNRLFPTGRHSSSQVMSSIPALEPRPLTKPQPVVKRSPTIRLEPVEDPSEDKDPDSEAKTLVAEVPEATATVVTDRPSVQPPQRVHRPSRGLDRALAIGGVALLVGSGAWWAWTRSADAPDPDVSQSSALVAEPVPTSTLPEPRVDVAEPEPIAHPPGLPVMLSELRKLSYAERHARLARASGDVPVELHVGLDLVQAAASDDPCRTFSDALSIVEGSSEPRMFLWALREAKIPTTGSRQGCKRLRARVNSVLTRAKPSQSGSRRRRTARAPDPAEPVAPEPTPSEVAPEPALPSEEVVESPSVRRNAVSTKLD